MKRITALLLAFIICFTFIIPPASAVRDVSMEQNLASDLKSLNLFKGVSDTDFDLFREPTRIEAVVMLIRVLGKEGDAVNGTWIHPFTDVPSWADKYIGYAYENGLAKGVSDTEFGPGNAGAAAYLTLTLRALGYTDSGPVPDFTYSDPFTLAKSLGVLPSEADTEDFLRADAVLISYAALSAKLKGTEQTLAGQLILDGVFTESQYKTYYETDAFTKSVLTSEQIFSQCSPAVFYLEVFNSAGDVVNIGSGFFLDSGGTAVTSWNVLDGGYSAKIKLPGSDTTYDVAGVYDYDKTNDWAILKVNGSGFSYLKTDSTESLLGSETVYAIGNPLGLENTVSKGLVSNPKRTIDGINFIQTSAAISAGSGGGPLINKYGEAIGITGGSLTDDGQNLNLALPISYIDGYKTDKVTTLFSLTAGPHAELKSYQKPKGIPDCGAFYDCDASDSFEEDFTTIYNYYPVDSLEKGGVWDDTTGSEKYRNVLLDWGANYITEYHVGTDHYWVYSIAASEKIYIVYVGEVAYKGAKSLEVKITYGIAAPTVGYTDCPQVPDFGALFGITVEDGSGGSSADTVGTDGNTSINSWNKVYKYSLDSLKSAGFDGGYGQCYLSAAEEFGFTESLVAKTINDHIGDLCQNPDLGYEVYFYEDGDSIIVDVHNYLTVDVESIIESTHNHFGGYMG